MSPEWKHSERHLTENQWFWFVAVIGLLTRLPLLGLSGSENTDGILSLTYFSKDFVATPRFVILPGYPLLLQLGAWLGLGGIFWGRIISCVAGLLILIPLWRYARRWMGVEMSAMVCLMALFSPLLWQWSLKVMPDTTFLLLFWWSLERLTAAYLDRSPRAWIEACLTAVAAACVRPEGLLLLPWILVLESRITHGRSWIRKAIFLASWALPLFLVREKVFLLFSAYREGAGLTTASVPEGFPFFNFVYHFYAYLTQPFYVFTPLVYIFAILGLAKMMGREDDLGQSFRRIHVQLFAILFISRLVPVTYQDRHLMPFLPILVVAAGYQLETFLNQLKYPPNSMPYHFIKNGLLAVTLLYSAVFSSAAIGGQMDSFGDIKRSAEFLKTLPANAVIYSDEIPKTQYWAGRTVTLLDYSQKPFMPHPGEYVILHSFYTPRINAVGDNMTARFGAALIHVDNSVVEPVMTDLMQDPHLQNRILATNYRFDPQFFTSVVYEIKSKSKEIK
jgi:hypothetical protein